MQIYQPKDGYCYNSDTLFLYDFALNFLKKHQKILEVGSGSGVLGMLCARDVEIDLMMIEKNPKMWELCQQNLRVNKIKAELLSGDFLQYDFLDLKFDCILSNPPFYHNGVIKSVNNDICMARYEENLPFEAMVQKINILLKPQGEFIFCYDCRESFKVFGILFKYKIRPITICYVHPKEDKEATLLLCRAKKDSKSQMRILPPIFTHNANGFTKKVQEIYKRANTWSIKC
ncbi:tRNA1(Val) (adenine(37)-N6)-methyltransferase [Helicobacter pullorum]|uniref:tRNA1(Val) (adenine(37)-N6)-methyltransferase n=1 Tax=Helicobacter pullorum TaxID=35818 RepID=UPI0006BB00F9|nr:methyltransferase [Helicobacter pullorum]KPH54387.1 SAM-dependent methyltransferase [Helicobacter pullorum]